MFYSFKPAKFCVRSPRRTRHTKVNSAWEMSARLKRWCAVRLRRKLEKFSPSQLVALGSLLTTAVAIPIVGALYCAFMFSGIDALDLMTEPLTIPYHFPSQTASSPVNEAFESYLDTLENAFIQDSIAAASSPNLERQ